MIQINAICTIHEDESAGLVAYRYHGEPAFVRMYAASAEAGAENSRHSALRALAGHMCRKEAATVRSVLGCFPQNLWADLVCAAVDTGKCLQHLMFQGLNGPSFSAGVLCGVEELVAQRRVNRTRDEYFAEHKYASMRLTAVLMSCAVLALSGAKGSAEYCVGAALGNAITDGEELDFRQSSECVTAVMDSFILLACGYWAAAL